MATSVHASRLFSPGEPAADLRPSFPVRTADVLELFLFPRSLFTQVAEARPFPRPSNGGISRGTRRSLLLAFSLVN